MRNHNKSHAFKQMLNACGFNYLQIFYLRNYLLFEQFFNLFVNILRSVAEFFVEHFVGRREAETF